MSDATAWYARWSALRARCDAIGKYIDLLMRHAEKSGPSVPPEILDRIERVLAAGEQAVAELAALRQEAAAAHTEEQG